jgi:hypothetical protein
MSESGVWGFVLWSYCIFHPFESINIWAINLHVTGLVYTYLQLSHHLDQLTIYSYIIVIFLSFYIFWPKVYFFFYKYRYHCLLISVYIKYIFPLFYFILMYLCKQVSPAFCKQCIVGIDFSSVQSLYILSIYIQGNDQWLRTYNWHFVNCFPVCLVGLTFISSSHIVWLNRDRDV